MALSAKTKTFFATAVSLWDSEFYIKVDDDVHVNLGKKKIIIIKMPSSLIFILYIISSILF